jgi:uncharacterized protein YdaU (DUF1376 family)
MPLVVGDWLKGTSGMRAEMKGVYINLLLHQWEHGFIPEDIEDLMLIVPEVGKVWDKLKVKFPKISDGQLQNKKLEEVRNFWKKQRKNGELGGRPKNENPEGNPKHNPNNIPKGNHHNDLDHDNDLNLKNKKESEENHDFKRPDFDGEELVFPIDTPAMRDLWAAWKESRWHNYELRYGLHGEQSDLTRMQGMSFHQIQETIQQAIAGKWKNLYPTYGKTTGQIRSSKEQQNAVTADYLQQHYTEKFAKK